MKEIRRLCLSALVLLLSPVCSLYDAKADIDFSALTSEEVIGHLTEGRVCEFCVMTDVALSDIDLRGINLRNSQIWYSQMSGTSLLEADFRNAEILFSDLSRSDLRMVNFENVVLRGVHVDESDFTGAIFRNALIEIVGFFESNDLTNVDFGNANIRQANFSDLNLRGTDFTNAHLGIVSFLGADLSMAEFEPEAFENVIYDSETKFPDSFSIPNTGMYLIDVGSSAVGVSIINVDLRDRNLSGIDLSDSSLGVDFSRAILNGAVFDGASVRRSNFIGTQLAGSRFCDAFIGSADLTQANLKNSYLALADLSFANLNNASLNQADLRGANLSNVLLENTDFEGAIYDDNTHFPEGFDPIAAGAILSNEAIQECHPLRQS